MPEMRVPAGRWWTLDGHQPDHELRITTDREPEPADDGSRRLLVTGWWFPAPDSPLPVPIKALVLPPPVPKPRQAGEGSAITGSRSEWVTLHVTDKRRVDAELRPDRTLVFHIRNAQEACEITIPPDVVPAMLAKLQPHGDAGGRGVDVLQVLRQCRQALTKAGVDTWLQRQHIPYAQREPQ